jgi:hypothetical protein
VSEVSVRNNVKLVEQLYSESDDNMVAVIKLIDTIKIQVDSLERNKGSAPSFIVLIPRNVDFYISKSNRVLQIVPENFYVTELTHIDGEGVDFFNRNTQEHLHINGHSFGIY